MVPPLLYAIVHILPICIFHCRMEVEIGVQSTYIVVVDSMYCTSCVYSVTFLFLCIAFLSHVIRTHLLPETIAVSKLSDKLSLLF